MEPDRRGPLDGIVGVTRALDFAARKHAHQRRKGIRAEPYVNHLTEVALLLAEASEGRDPGLVMAGLLHDTIEDTETTAEEIAAQFGAEVAAVVLEVTDDKNLPKAERKAAQVAHAPHISRPAQLVKLADKTCNLRDVAASPPVGWSLERRREYFDWAKRVVDGMRGAHPGLEAVFDGAFAQRP